MIEERELDINSEEDIKTLLSTFTQNQAGIIRIEGLIICSIYYQDNDWMFMFSGGGFANYTFSIPEDREDITRNLSHWSRSGAKAGRRLVLTVLSSKEEMFFEIRQDIINSCMDALTQTKFTFGGKELDSNLPGIVLEVKNNLGKVVTMTPGSGITGILAGLECTIEDYYYIQLTDKYGIRFCSCCSGFEVLDQKDIPVEFQKILKDTAGMRNVLYKHFSDPQCTSVCLLSI